MVLFKWICHLFGYGKEHDIAQIVCWECIDEDDDYKALDIGKRIDLVDDMF